MTETGLIKQREFHIYLLDKYFLENCRCRYSQSPTEGRVDLPDSAQAPRGHVKKYKNQIELSEHSLI